MTVALIFFLHIYTVYFSVCGSWHSGVNERKEKTYMQQIWIKIGSSGSLCSVVVKGYPALCCLLELPFYETQTIQWHRIEVSMNERCNDDVDDNDDLMIMM